MMHANLLVVGEGSPGQGSLPEEVGPQAEPGRMDRGMLIWEKWKVTKTSKQPVCLRANEEANWADGRGRPTR